MHASEAMIISRVTWLRDGDPEQTEGCSGGAGMAGLRLGQGEEQLLHFLGVETLGTAFLG